MPGVDHVLHIAGTVIHPVAGALLFVAQTDVSTGIPAAVAAVLGAATAETLHGGRAALRPASTATTGGVGNPFLSLGEDATSLALTVLAFALPLLALLLVLALLAAILSAGQRLSRRRGRPRRLSPVEMGRDPGEPDHEQRHAGDHRQRVGNTLPGTPRWPQLLGQDSNLQPSG